MKTKSDFEIIAITDGFVHLVDLDLGRMSVTNDAEAVVAELFSKFGNRRFVYRDTDGRWDELVHSNGRFTKFAPWKPFDSLPDVIAKLTE